MQIIIMFIMAQFISLYPLSSNYHKPSHVVLQLLRNWNYQFVICI